MDLTHAGEHVGSKAKKVRCSPAKFGFYDPAKTHVFCSATGKSVIHTAQRDRWFARPGPEISIKPALDNRGPEAALFRLMCFVNADDATFRIL